MTVLTKFRSDFPLGLRGPFESLLSDFEPFSDREKTFVPAHEVIKSENFYQILLEVPGVKREDISLDLEKRTLIISGEKKKTENSPESSSRIYSSFNQSFRLPEDVEEEEISAKLEEGVLAITLKRLEKKEKKIEIT